MSSWTGGAVFHILPKEIPINPILCSSVCSPGLVVSPPLRLCPNPRGYPTTHTRSTRRLAHLVKPLQVTAELEVEALRDVLRDLVQLCHHLVHDVDMRSHDRKSMVFPFSVPT
jgi:hypothetical protein